MRQPAEKPGVPELAREQKVQRFCRGKSWGGRYVLEDAKSCRGAWSPVPLETLPPNHPPPSDQAPGMVSQAVGKGQPSQ